MEITPLQTEQRARTPDGGTFAGSTRKMERQSGQLTFIHSLRWCVHRESPVVAPAESRGHRCVDQQYKPSREGSWRTSSSPLPAGSPVVPKSACVAGSSPPRSRASSAELDPDGLDDPCRRSNPRVDPARSTG